jgi:hypothetical protein
MPLSEAIIFETMKDARRQLNRLNGRLLSRPVAAIENLN